MNRFFRSIFGAYVGYLAMVIFIIIVANILMTSLEWEFILKPDTIWPTEDYYYFDGPNRGEASAAWCLITLALAFLGAFVGGILTRRIDRSNTGAWILGGLIFATCIVAMFWTEYIKGLEFAAVGSFTVAKPLGIKLLNPVLGCVGVWVATLLIPKRHNLT